MRRGEPSGEELGVFLDGKRCFRKVTFHSDVLHECFTEPVIQDADCSGISVEDGIGERVYLISFDSHGVSLIF
jgi:hypothetical protein